MEGVNCGLQVIVSSWELKQPKPLLMLALGSNTMLSIMFKPKVSIFTKVWVVSVMVKQWHGNVHVLLLFEVSVINETRRGREKCSSHLLSLFLSDLLFTYKKNKNKKKTKYMKRNLSLLLTVLYSFSVRPFKLPLLGITGTGKYLTPILGTFSFPIQRSWWQQNLSELDCVGRVCKVQVRLGCHIVLP